MLFPQRDTFTYISESEDKYGTITESSATTHLGYIENEVTFGTDGGVVGRGKVFTTDTTSFESDAKITINDDIYYINNVRKFTLPGYIYQELAYV